MNEFLKNTKDSTKVLLASFHGAPLPSAMKGGQKNKMCCHHFPCYLSTHTHQGLGKVWFKLKHFENKQTCMKILTKVDSRFQIIQVMSHVHWVRSKYK